MPKVEITKFDHVGRGIAHLNGKVTFVNNAIPEETVDIKLIQENKKYNLAEVIKFHKTSPKRIEPICPYFNECGGCDLLHLNYEDTLEFKHNKLEEILSRYADINQDIEVIPNENPLNYRNKINLKIVNKKLGFYQKESHKLIEIDYCYITKNVINNIIKDLKKLDITNGDITVRCNYNDELLISINTFDKLKIEIDYLKQNHKIVGLILNNKLIYGKPYFIEIINTLIFQVSYKSFFQINNYINSKVLDILKNIDFKNKSILDLYCGVGSLGISIAKNAQEVYGIEIVERSILDAIQNIKMNKITNAKYLLGDTANTLKKINKPFDYLILDPPRNGLDKITIEYIKETNPENIFYMSCDPMTLARDLKELKDKYIVEKIYLLDMFSYTYHVETIVILKSNTKIFKYIGMLK